MTVTKHFFIKILTPVHIGCDEVYDPLSFVVDEGRKKIVVFDPLDFFGHLSEKDRNQLNEICRKGTVSSLLELMKFMRGKKAVGWEVDVCRGFISHYANSLSMGLGDERRIQQELNRFEIKRTAYNPYTLRPYLPGSSIKGSLRTAYLNLIAKKKPHVKSNPKEKKANIRLEQELLDYNDIESDPFRMLKVSDFLPVKATTRIVYAVNEKKTGQEGARGLSQILEIVEPGSWFVGTISVTEQKERHPKIRHQLTMENLLLGVKNFYEKEKGREERELQLAKINPCHLDVDGGCLLRLGHHSGAESVTIEGHRSILIRGKKKYYSDKATTFWLAAEDRNKYDKSKILPFGWCLLGEVKVEQEKEWQKIEEAISSISYPQPQLETALEGEEHIKIERTIEEWTSAYVKWNPGNQEVIATYEGKKATARGKDIVREAMRKKLVDKRETVRTKVLVEKIYNRYTIVKIDEAE